MPSQIFKSPVPHTMMFCFLDQVCEKDDDKHVFDIVAFKRANFINSIPGFIDNIRDYYHKSKQFYLDRKQTYTTFVTIIRQICKHNHIPYNTIIVYEKSSYYIKYEISKK